VRVVVETRPKLYAGRVEKRGFLSEIQHRAGEGTEIVREQDLCMQCATIVKVGALKAQVEAA
jgi:hypothetical protein